MKISRAIPGDVSWEIDDPIYRIDFWERPPHNPALGNSAKVGFAVDENYVSEVEGVHEAIAWAEENSGAGRGVHFPGVDRVYTLYAVIDLPDPSGRGLARLAGREPQ